MARIPLALLPGTLCTAALWAYQIEALADIADIRVVETAAFTNANHKQAATLPLSVS